MDDWLVQIPLSDLVSLHDLLPELERQRKENAQLRREFDALRNMFTELMMAFGDYKRYDQAQRR